MNTHTRTWELVVVHNNGTGCSTEYHGSLQFVLGHMALHRTTTPDARYTLVSIP